MINDEEARYEKSTKQTFANFNIQANFASELSINRMILKSFEIKKINQNINQFNIILWKNEGLKNEAIDILIKD